MRCEYCETINHSNAKFCKACGKPLIVRRINDRPAHFRFVLFFYFLQLLLIAVLSFVENEANFVNSIIESSIYAIIVVLFFLLDSSKTSSLFAIERLKPMLLIGIVVLMPVFSLGVHYGLVALAELFNLSVPVYYFNFIDSPAPFLFAFVSVAVFPAVFEEIAFRGIIFGRLTDITRLKQAIFLSALMFTILHLSLLSFVWIFPFGLFLGYLRARYRTIWYGIICHLMHNGTIIFLEFLEFG